MSNDLLIGIFIGCFIGAIIAYLTISISPERQVIGDSILDYYDKEVTRLINEKHELNRKLGRVWHVEGMDFAIFWNDKNDGRIFRFSGETVTGKDSLDTI